MKNINHQIIHLNLATRPGIIFIKTPNISTSIVSLWFQAGARYVPKGKDGLAHLFEHLFIVSNKKHPEKKKYLAEMEKAGLLYNAYTFKDLVTYYFVCSPGDEILALDQLIEAYHTTIITQKALIQEKKIVKNEEGRNKASPSTYIWRLAYQGLWQKTELASDTSGFPQTINSITLEDTDSFKNKFYQPNNMSVVIIAPQDLKLEGIRKILNPLGKHKTRQFPKTKFFSVIKSIHENREIENLHTVLAYRYGSLSFKERVIIRFINHYLAGGWSAKLIHKLRSERGLTYWVNSKILNTYDSGFIGFYYMVKKDDFGQSIKLIRDEVDRLRSRKIELKTLEDYKKPFFVKTGQILNNLYDLFYYYGQFVLSSRKITHPYLYKEVVDIIQKLTSEEVQKVASKHLNNDNSIIVTVGNAVKATF